MRVERVGRVGGDGHGVGGGGRPKLHQEDPQAARPGPWRHWNVPWPRRCVKAAIHGVAALGVHLRVVSKMGVWEGFGYGFRVHKGPPKAPIRPTFPWMAQHL